MRKVTIGIGAAVLAAAAIMAIVRTVGPSTADHDTAPGAAGPAGVVVETAETSLGRAAHELAAVGTLEANQDVIIRPEISGRVAEIVFDNGAPVERNQVLVRLDDALLRAELAQARAHLALSQRNYERARELNDRGIVARRAYDEAAAKLAADQAAVTHAEERLDKTVLRAPFPGVVGLRALDVGAYAAAGQDVVRLVSIDPLRVRFRVPERYAPQIVCGQRLRIVSRTHPARVFDAAIVAVDPAIDAGTRSLLVEGVVPNGDSALRPGQFVTVSLDVDVREDALFVPESALTPRRDGTFVFIATGTAARLARVSIGARRRGIVEIVEGLRPGDRVVVAGHEKLRDGTAIRVRDGGIANDRVLPREGTTR